MRSFVLLLVCLNVGLFAAGCNSTTPDDGGVDSGQTTGGSTISATTSATTPNSSSQTTSTAPANYGVNLYDSRFDPVTLTVPNYQKVIFTNAGSLTHTVTIVRQGDPVGTTYRDQPVQSGATVDFNFPNDGVYTVYCRYHGSETSGMRMTINV